ncbi:S-layer homology domain-containing protein [Candidatus Margulisiibacteriota bacterium]
MRRSIAILILIALALPCAAQFVARDPTHIVPSGRVLGLGKAYVGLADDTAAIFTNPAGMVAAEGWQLSSLQGKLLDEYSFLAFSGLYPTEYGVFGLGFAGTSISGAWATTIESGSDPDDPIYTIDTSQPQMGNYNNAVVISYANHLKNIKYLDRLPFAERLSVGANLKLFQVALYGDGIVGGDATGQELDLGVKIFPPQKWLTFGVALQNALPFSMGGKLHYDSGHEESYLAILELGSAVRLLGKKDALRTLGNHELCVLADIDYHPSLPAYPAIMHLGLEWQPMPLVSIRTGIDQTPGADGNGGFEIVSDQTYGVGLNFSNFHFDYAYHTLTGAPDVTNHFFSLSYAFQPRVIVGEPLEVIAPPDKLITFEAAVSVSGKAKDPGIRKLTMNQVAVRLALDGRFQAMADLKIGKNAILLEGRESGDKVIASKKLRSLRLKPFPDVEPGHWVRVPISLLAMQTIITGYPNGLFKPGGNITRAEMCTLLMKTRKLGDKLASPEAGAKATEEATEDVKLAFSDVSAKHWAAPYVARAAELGVVLGYPDGTFKPKNNITRAEGVAMIARFAGIPKINYTGQFPDVPSRHWAAEIISGAHWEGILVYLENKNFELKRLLTRAETVEMLYRTSYVRDEVLAKDLLNWDTY